jgi:hypothetical protein
MPFELLIVVCRACARERGFVKERGGPLLSLLSLLLLPLLASRLRQLAQVIRSDPAKKRTTRVLRQRTLGAQPHRSAAGASPTFLSTREVAAVGEPETRP